MGRIGPIDELFIAADLEGDDALFDGRCDYEASVTAALDELYGSKDGTYVCPECNKRKRLREFSYRSRGGSGGIGARICNVCCAIRNRKWQILNRDRLNAYYRKRWAERDRSAPKPIKKAVNIFRRMRTPDREGISRKLHGKTAECLWRSLMNPRNRANWEQQLGYSRRELAEHLESQFKGDMGWHNVDKWHVSPNRKFNYTTEYDPGYRATWALSNLKPEWRDVIR